MVLRLLALFLFFNVTAFAGSIHDFNHRFSLVRNDDGMLKGVVAKKLTRKYFAPSSQKMMLDCPARSGLSSAFCKMLSSFSSFSEILPLK